MLQVKSAGKIGVLCVDCVTNPRERVFDPVQNNLCCFLGAFCLNCDAPAKNHTLQQIS